jgi:RHS repeat-associated protein
LKSPATPFGEIDQPYGFDTSGRFNTTVGYTYTYTANSHLLASIAHTSSGWTQTRAYLSNANILDVIETKFGATTKAKFDYTHDNLYRVITSAKTGELFSTYGNGTQGLETDYAYNDRSELTADSTALGGSSTPLTGRDDYHAYDPIGNRTSVNRSGTTLTFNSNSLNQYTSFTGSSTHTYDDDGNLLNDGQWTYQWNAENKLVAQDSITHVRRLEFKYDHLGRRVQKTVREGWNGSAYATVVADLKFLYDRHATLLELDATALTKVKAHVWGLDLSGTLHRAGGVGGLLYTYHYGTATSWMPVYDGNGNIGGYLKSTDGAFGVKLEHDAFGRELVATGTALASVSFRFATKYADTETGNIHYNTREYSPSLGRFLGRDTIGEAGGLNLYAYVMNRVPNAYDILGMDADFRSVPSTTFRWWFTNYRIPIAQVIRVKSERELEKEYTPSKPPPPGRANMPDLYEIIRHSIPVVPDDGRLDVARDRTQVDVALLLAIAYGESTFNPAAKNARSTATGLYQILSPTKADLEDRVYPNFVTTADRFGADVSGDWRLDPSTATAGAYLILLDRIASGGNDLIEGLKRYRGDRGEIGENYADVVIRRRDAINAFAAELGGDLGDAIQADWNRLITKLDAIRPKPREPKPQPRDD